MNESDFDRLAEQTFAVIEDAVENCGVDIDYDTAGGILTLEFANGSQIIINKQAALSQIWIAARSGGYHFEYDSADEVWRLQGRADELFDCLAIYCSEQAGVTVNLEY